MPLDRLPELRAALGAQESSARDTKRAAQAKRPAMSATRASTTLLPTNPNTNACSAWTRYSESGPSPEVGQTSYDAPFKFTWSAGEEAHTGVTMYLFLSSREATERISEVHVQRVNCDARVYCLHACV